MPNHIPDLALNRSVVTFPRCLEFLVFNILYPSSISSLWFSSLFTGTERAPGAVPDFDFTLHV